MDDSKSQRLLALLLVQQLKGSPQREKAKLLSLAGYSNVEIADLLETSPGVIAQMRYEARKLTGKSKSRNKQSRAKTSKARTGAKSR